MPKLRLLDVPNMILGLVWGLIVFTLTEVETFLLAVACVFWGIQLGALWGITIYLSTYYITRMLGGYVSLVAHKLDWIGVAISRRKNV